MSLDPGYRVADPRLKRATEVFLGGRLSASLAMAQMLWAEGARDPALATLYGELQLLANRLTGAAEALGVALGHQPENPRLIGLMAEVDRRAGRFAEAAEGVARLGRTGKAARLAALARTGAMLVRDGPGRAEVDWVARTPLPAVLVRCGGVELQMLLDTGVGDTLLDTESAARLDVSVLGAEMIQFPAGPSGRVDLGILPEIRLGPLVIGQVPVQVMPLRASFAALGQRPVDGIIGTGLFSRFRTRLDYGAGRLALEPDGGPDLGTPMYRAGEHYPLLEARINDRLDALLFLDTGMSGAAFGVPLGLAEAAGLEAQADQTVTGLAMGGGLAAVPTRASRLVAGGCARDAVAGILMGQFRLERQFGFRIAGLMGGDFVDDGHITLDFPAMRVSIDGVDVPRV